MEVSTRREGDQVHVTVAGRLDAHWADRLAVELEAAVTDGARHMRLDLNGLEFISSAGLRLLLRYYKQLHGLHGSLVVTDCSAPVKMVIALAGFEHLLGLSSAAGRSAPSGGKGSRSDGGERVELGAATYEKFETDLGAALVCRLVGGDGARPHAAPSDAACRTMQFPSGTMALGIGAFGQDAAECRDRFGRFLAAAGAVVSHGADGADVPDYLLQSGAFLPDVQVLTCLSCEGPFSHQIRFEAKPGAGSVPFDQLVESCLELAHCEAAGMVLLAEAARVVGQGGHPSALGGSRKDAERATQLFPRSTVLAVGIAAREDRPALEDWLRPLGACAWPSGWFHAAVFSFCPLRAGLVDLQEAVGALFESERLEGLLQPASRAGGTEDGGTSEFIRGTCWLGPLGPIQRERGRP
ncbi:MAG: STAS domain-containing protein [Nitrospirota bacterium]|nr:STAS domain-containing protein [Nitrospirota bacterium]